MAAFAPAGNEGGASPHFRSAAANMMCSDFATGFSSSASASEPIETPRANNRMEASFFMAPAWRNSLGGVKPVCGAADCATVSNGMKKFVWTCLILIPVAMSAEETAPQLDAKAAQRLADLALACVGKEY